MSTELLVLTVLATVLLLIVIADRLDLPYPILLVLGGLGLGFAPGVPDFRLNPDVVLLIVLPPLLYSAAFFSSLRELRNNLRAISLLAIGLVLATMGAVAVVAHAIIPGLSWEAAFVLGAIVSPTDPVAASAILQRLSVPRRVVTVVEGESLINDATALVAYRVAVVAVVSGSFSLVDAGAVRAERRGGRGDRAGDRLGDRARCGARSRTRRSRWRSRSPPPTSPTCPPRRWACRA